MKFLTKLDDEFLNRAIDDNQRVLAIERLKSSRTSYYVCGFLIIIATIALELTGRSGLLPFGLVCWIIAFKYESDIRILRAIDYLQKRYEK